MLQTRTIRPDSVFSMDQGSISARKTNTTKEGKHLTTIIRGLFACLFLHSYSMTEINYDSFNSSLPVTETKGQLSTEDLAELDKFVAFKSESEFYGSI